MQPEGVYGGVRKICFLRPQIKSKRRTKQVESEINEEEDDRGEDSATLKKRFGTIVGSSGHFGVLMT